MEKGSVKHMDFNPSLMSSSDKCLATRADPPTPNTEIVDAFIILSARSSSSSQVAKEKDFSMLSILDEKTFLKISFLL